MLLPQARLSTPAREQVIWETGRMAHNIKLGRANGKNWTLPTPGWLLTQEEAFLQPGSVKRCSWPDVCRRRGGIMLCDRWWKADRRKDPAIRMMKSTTCISLGHIQRTSYFCHLNRSTNPSLSKQPASRRDIPL